MSVSLHVFVFECVCDSEYIKLCWVMLVLHRLLGPLHMGSQYIGAIYIFMVGMQSCQP